MLESLHVKNLALIDETEVVFRPGLNILTGETGAGKSIVIGSINLALGAKSDKDMIRSGEEYALIELVFSNLSKAQEKIISDMDISLEDDFVVLQRKISATRSVCKVCGETVSAKQLKELAEVLIDIHGQHDNQFLLNKKKHLEILDQFIGQEISQIKEQIKSLYQDYRKLSDKITESMMDEKERNREVELLQFECDEIRNANLISGEDQDLEQLYRRMLNSKKLLESMSVIHQLTGYESSDGSGNTVGRGLKELRSIQSLDMQVESLSEQLVAIDDLLNDFNRALAEYQSELEFDDSSFYKTEDRLNLINRLKSKYGNTVDSIMEYLKEKSARLELLMDFDVYKQKLEQEMTLVRGKLLNACEKASGLRMKYGKELEVKLEKALKELNFLDVSFKIGIIKEEDSISSQGYDEVEFLISTNPGEPVKPLSNVASGGELSRIMLALKTIIAGEDGTKTLIFDEIDAGISGKTAWQVSQKLGTLSKQNQIICITHLPQIAAMADQHYLIEKQSENKSTKTSIVEIKGDFIIEELSRLLGSDQITETVRNNAREMKETAKNTKF